MKTSFKWSLALMFGLYVAQVQSKELLRVISDETATPVAQPEQPVEKREGEIIYRVICSPEGEMLPECDQPPVTDSLKPEPSKPVGPKNADKPAVTEPLEQRDEDGQSVDAVEPEAPKKATKHKKHSKKHVRKRTE